MRTHFSTSVPNLLGSPSVCRGGHSEVKVGSDKTCSPEVDDAR